MSAPEMELLEAVNSDRFEAVRTILRNYPEIDIDKFNCIHWAITFGKEEMTNLLLSAGANFNAYGMAGRETPLIIALRHEYPNLAERLLQAGADANLATPSGETPLMVADTPEMVKLLIKHGADVNVTNSKGATPLMNAINYHRFDVAKVLIAAGADLNCIDKYGYTPLILAVEKGLEDFVRLLLKAGADASACTASGVSLLELTQHRGIQKLIKAYQRSSKEGVAEPQASAPPSGKEGICTEEVSASRKGSRSFFSRMFSSSGGNNADPTATATATAVVGNEKGGVSERAVMVTPTAVLTNIKEGGVKGLGLESETAGPRIVTATAVLAEHDVGAVTAGGAGRGPAEFSSSSGREATLEERVRRLEDLAQQQARDIVDLKAQLSGRSC